MTEDALRRTPLHGLHESLGARMAPFAGYDMPIQYQGIIAEHRWTREKAGLFDVSHMGQAFLKTTEAAHGDAAAHAAVAAAIETLAPGDIAGLAPGAMRYSLLLSETGGILDDLMITRPARDDLQGSLFLVVNAATKDADFALVAGALSGRATLEIAADRALLALQGPSAEKVLGALLPGVADSVFLTMRPFEWDGADLIVSRSGYTGEDGFEISVPASHAEALASRLLAHEDVKPIGLGARDTLRLEAGLCLYGHDIDAATSPIEASLAWAVPKVRRARADFPGAERILRELADGPTRKRVGLKLRDKAPAREGCAILGDGATCAEIGTVTSGGFGPTVEAPIAMGYVAAAHAAKGTAVEIDVRGRGRPADIVAMPFAPHRYKRG